MDFTRLTDRSRKVLQFAHGEAITRRHEFVSTEHVLLGLVKETNGIAGTVLNRFGVLVEQVSREIYKLTPDGSKRLYDGPPYTPRLQKCLEAGWQQARELGHDYIGTEHLLLGLLSDNECPAVQILLNLKVDPADARKEVLMLLKPEEKAKQVLPDNFRLVKQIVWNLSGDWAENDAVINLEKVEMILPYPTQLRTSKPHGPVVQIFFRQGESIFIRGSIKEGFSQGE